MSGPARSHGRILVVDDEPGNVLLLEHLLELAGHEDVHSTTDPTEVERLYRDLRPDLVLLDLHMPILDGFAVMRRLAECSGSGDAPPILVLTADATAASRQAALHAGASDFVTKPFENRDVLARVARLLDAPAGRHESATGTADRGGALSGAGGGPAASPPRRGARTPWSARAPGR